MILGFQTILKNCQASSKFEAVNSTWLSSCQRHVKPIFVMKWRPRAFSRVSTGDSDILSSCDSVVGDSLSSIKKIEAPYVFDWENAIALDTLHGNRASSCSEGKVSWVFLCCGRNLGYILELRWGWPFETRVCSVWSGLLTRYDGHLRNLN